MNFFSYSYLPILVQNADQKHVSVDQDQSSMLKVICNQRDRFRARLRETEEACYMLYNLFVNADFSL
jgi:homeobox protein cut-like